MVSKQQVEAQHLLSLAQSLPPLPTDSSHSLSFVPIALHFSSPTSLDTSVYPLRFIYSLFLLFSVHHFLCPLLLLRLFLHSSHIFHFHSLNDPSFFTSFITTPLPLPPYYYFLLPTFMFYLPLLFAIFLLSPPFISLFFPNPSFSLLFLVVLCFSSPYSSEDPGKKRPL